MKATPRFRTRYAPSPTGELHIGNARTAVFCYLLAKHYQGDFIIRIEDTDLERNKKEAVKSQLDNLQWLGVEYDEGPNKETAEINSYYQSERLDLYLNYLHFLLRKKLVYPCYCTKEELDQKREQQKKEGKKSFMYDQTCLHLSKEKKELYQREGRKPVYRFQVKDENEKISWNDLIRGEITFDSKDIEDFIIFKANGFPVYNFANVIDDHLMKITHVIRGEEHISNTPKQLLLYQAFGWTPPQFAHLSIIVNRENKKLSKRDANTIQFINQYKKEQLLPQAILNYLVFLGWTSGEEREIYTKQELIKLFDFNRISKAPAKYDVKKLLWFNKEYIKSLSPEQLTKIKEKMFAAFDVNCIFQHKKYTFNHLVSDILGINEWTFKEHQKVIKENIERIKTSVVWKWMDAKISAVSGEKRVTIDIIKSLLDLNLVAMEKRDNEKYLVLKENLDLIEKKMKEAFKKWQKKHQLQPKQFFQLLRKSITGQHTGPDLWKLLVIFLLIYYSRNDKTKR